MFSMKDHQFLGQLISLQPKVTLLILIQVGRLQSIQELLLHITRLDKLPIESDNQLWGGCSRTYPSKEEHAVCSNGLYLLTLKCSLPAFDPKQTFWGSRTLTKITTLTISNNPVSSGEVPPASSTVC